MDRRIVLAALRMVIRMVRMVNGMLIIVIRFISSPGLYSGSEDGPLNGQDDWINCEDSKFSDFYPIFDNIYKIL